MMGYAALLLGAVAVAGSGGSWRNLEFVRLKFQIGVIVLFTLQVPARSISTLAWGIVTGCMLVLLLANLRATGVSLMAAGLVCNLTVVTLNGGMPVVGSRGEERVLPHFYHFASAADSAVLLADILPAPGGYLLSLGDVLLVVGVVVLLSWGAAPRGSATGESFSFAGKVSRGS